jgi:hypothetical protein
MNRERDVLSYKSGVLVVLTNLNDKASGAGLFGRVCKRLLVQV